MQLKMVRAILYVDLIQGESSSHGRFALLIRNRVKRGQDYKKVTSLLLRSLVSLQNPPSLLHKIITQATRATTDTVF
jgi:hypothetical protein